MIKTKIFARIGKEYLHVKGKEIGLSGDALEMFKCFTEVPLLVEIDDKGIVQAAIALWGVNFDPTE